MKIVIIIVSAIIVFAACAPEPQNKYLTYQNIVIFSDLSSRVKNCPLQKEKDVREIHKILQYFKDECVKPGEKIGDKSSISFYTFSAKPHVSIDIEKYKTLIDKQQFINSTGKYSENGLVKKLDEFENDVKKLYKTVYNDGLDLISLLIEKIENKQLIKHDIFLTNGIDTTYIRYENHIYIFTDGYLEYSRDVKRRNSQYYFGEEKIKEVRQYCISSNVDVHTALNKNRDLHLPPCKKPQNKFVNLHILETASRDKDTNLNTYDNPSGLHDNEILEAVWYKWAIESGFKSFEWRRTN
jgi:hypothetical protein